MRTPSVMMMVLLACGSGDKHPITPVLPPEPDAAPVAAKQERETWAGTLAMVGDLVDITVTFAKQDGAWTATLGIPKAKADGIPLVDVTLAADSIKFTLVKPNKLPAEAYVFARTGDTGVGAMVIAGEQFYAKLVKLAPGEAPRTVIARPQTPQPPFPYGEREVSITAPEAGVLAGTLTIPSGTGPFPAVVLFTGSGQQDRDETIYGHRPFRVLADHLTRAGFVVLRTDDRGVGKTTGKVSSLDTEIGDGRAAFEWLIKQAEVDPKRAGILGHSYGGYVAPAVAAKTQKAAFVVSLAGPALPGPEFVATQIEAMMTAAKVPQPQIAKTVAAQRSIGAAIAKGDPKLIRAAMVAAVREAAAAQNLALDDKTLDAVVEQKLAGVTDPWPTSMFKSKPADAWKQVKCPVLAVIGDKDLQVPADLNLAATASALRANKDVTTKKLPGLNHLYQHAVAGAVTEYGAIEETFDPATLDLIATWMTAKTTKPTKR